MVTYPFLHQGRKMLNSIDNQHVSMHVHVHRESLVEVYNHALCVNPEYLFMPIHSIKCRGNTLEACMSHVNQGTKKQTIKQQN